MRRLRSVAQGIFFVACLLSIVPELPAQIPDTWQEIPKDDLALKDNPANPGSSAMILERQVYTDDEKRIQTEWLRIKILTEEGRAYADVEIPYLAKSITIEGIRGRTVRPNGNVITFDGTTFDKVVAKYRRFLYEAKAFALPGVTAEVEQGAQAGAVDESQPGRIHDKTGLARGDERGNLVAKPVDAARVQRPDESDDGDIAGRFDRHVHR